MKLISKSIKSNPIQIQTTIRTSKCSEIECDYYSMLPWNIVFDAAIDLFTETEYNIQIKNKKTNSLVNLNTLRLKIICSQLYVMSSIYKNV